MRSFAERAAGARVFEVAPVDLGAEREGAAERDTMAWFSLAIFRKLLDASGCSATSAQKSSAAAEAWPQPDAAEGCGPGGGNARAPQWPC